jgi:hypothetical protein
MGVGFLLLAAPLALAALALSDNAAGVWANGVAALILAGVGLALLRGRSA